MNQAEPPTPAASPRQLTHLVTAVRKNKALDSRQLLTEITWDALSQVLARRTVAPRECLIQQGDNSRSLYFLETGSAKVYRSQQGARLQLAVLGAGSVIGEGTFFAQVVRSASVETLEPADVWELTPEGFDTLVRRHPLPALQLCRYLGAVLATRMLSVSGRLSIT